MPRRSRAALPATVKRLGARIEQWRRTRERRTAMPAELWSEAVLLAGSEGAYPVARALRLNFEGLKRRIAEAGSTGSAAAAGAFVEFSGAQLLGAPPLSGTVVELSDAAGVRLTMRLAKDADLNVAQVVAAFRQGRP